MIGASVDDVISRIDRDELVRFVLEICNIDSSVGHEGAVAERLEDWLSGRASRSGAACVYARAALTICG